VNALNILFWYIVSITIGRRNNGVKTSINVDSAGTGSWHIGPRLTHRQKKKQLDKKQEEFNSNDLLT
jgi:hypothetical protein